MQTEVQAKSKSLLGVSDLTLTAPIKRGLIPALDARSYESRLRLLLKTLSALRTSSLEVDPTPLIADMIDNIRAIHSFRLAIVGQEPKMLVLSVAFDGGWEPYMRRIWRDLGPLLDLIFINCDGYLSSAKHSFPQYAAWVRAAQVPTEFFYTATGLSVNDLHYLRRARLDPDSQARLDSATQTRLKSAAHVPAADAAVTEALPAATALYRLTDMYPPKLHDKPSKGADDPDEGVDGEFLERAALHLLPALRKLARTQTAMGRTPTERAALRWFSNAAEAEAKAPAEAKQRQPEPTQIALAHQRVQGGILQPYADVTHACLLLIELRNAAAVQALLEYMQLLVVDSATNAAPKICANLAFTLQGLELAGVEGGTLQEMPAEFREGMAARASILGDVRYNHPTKWDLPKRNWPKSDQARPQRVELSSVHAVVQLAVRHSERKEWQELSDEPTEHPLLEAVDSFDQRLASEGVQILSVQSMQRFTDDDPPLGLTRDRFGFVDGLSQPVLEDAKKAIKHSDVVKLGDLLLGYENSLGDPAQVGRLWDDSTFLVVRKLRQDVQALSALEKSFPEPENLLKSRMMGRQVNGENLFEEASIGNDFNYDSDLDGRYCPIQSHVRRANPRTPRTAADGSENPPVPRIMRRGMSYGPPVGTDPEAESGKAHERGVMFMAYNASIAEQFEVIQSWLSGGNSNHDRSYSALRDPFVGVPQDHDPRSFVFHKDPKDPKDPPFSLVVPPDKPLVKLEWGLYLFVPSLKALDELRDRAREAALTERGVPPGDKKKNDRREIELSLLAQKGAAVIAGLRQLEQVQGFDAAKTRWKIALEDVSARMSGASQAVWAAVRKLHQGVLHTPYGVLVCTKERVKEVLSNDAVYTATGYAERMDKSFGRIYLGRDKSDDAYKAESETANAEIEKVSVDEAFMLAWGETKRTVGAWLAKPSKDGSVTVDVKDVVDEVLAGLSKHWFGIPDGINVVSGGWHWSPDDRPTCPGHFHSPSRYMFQPNPGKEAESVGQRHGLALKRAAETLVKDHDSAETLPTAPLARAIFKAFPGDVSKRAHTLIGVMMGFLPTVDGNLRGVLYEWITDRSLWDHQSAYFASFGKTPFERADEVLLPPLRRALQLRPVPELVWRIAKSSHVLGGVQVNAGDTVVASIVSAMQETRLNDEDDIFPLFGGDRSKERHPPHACPGYKMAIGVMLGTLAGLLESANLRPTLSPMALRLSRLGGPQVAVTTGATPAGDATSSPAA